MSKQEVRILVLGPTLKVLVCFYDATSGNFGSCWLFDCLFVCFVTVAPDTMVDELGAILNKYEVPMGLMNKLMMLSEYEYMVRWRCSFFCSSIDAREFLGGRV